MNMCTSLGARGRVSSALLRAAAGALSCTLRAGPMPAPTTQPPPPRNRHRDGAGQVAHRCAPEGGALAAGAAPGGAAGRGACGAAREEAAGVLCCGCLQHGGDVCCAARLEVWCAPLDTPPHKDLDCCTEHPPTAAAANMTAAAAAGSRGGAQAAGGAGAAARRQPAARGGSTGSGSGSSGGDRRAVRARAAAGARGAAADRQVETWHDVGGVIVAWLLRHTASWHVGRLQPLCIRATPKSSKHAS